MSRFDGINSIQSMKRGEKVYFIFHASFSSHSVFRARGDDKAESWKSIYTQYLHVGAVPSAM